MVVKVLVAKENVAEMSINWHNIVIAIIIAIIIGVITNISRRPSPPTININLNVPLLLQVFHSFQTKSVT